jgi:hypothetical protein
MEEQERGYSLDKPLLLSVCSGLGKFVQKPGSEARIYVKDDDCLGAWRRVQAKAPGRRRAARGAGGEERIGPAARIRAFELCLSRCDSLPCCCRAAAARSVPEGPAALPAQGRPRHARCLLPRLRVQPGPLGPGAHHHHLPRRQGPRLQRAYVPLGAPHGGGPPRRVSSCVHGTLCMAGTPWQRGTRLPGTGPPPPPPGRPFAPLLCMPLAC